MNARSNDCVRACFVCSALLSVGGLEVTAYAQARTFTFANQCNETVWVGTLGNPGKGNPNGGGWALSAGASTNVSIPAGWAGRFWGRRECSFDSNGNGSCATGSCGRLQCNGAGGVPPTSLAEFTLGAPDFYDVSLVDGYDFPVAISPSNGSCGAPTCTSDLLSSCPSELQRRDGAGRLVACASACEQFNTPMAPRRHATRPTGR
jgi:hypothetical protein